MGDAEMSRWLEMARAAEKPSVPFANIAKNAKNPEKHEQRVPKVNIGNIGKRQTGSHGKSSRPAEWDGNDFRAFYDERAAILEYDGELARPEAERLAFEATIIHWMNATPPSNLDFDHCAQCREPVGRIGRDAVPVLTGGEGHAWLHHGCHRAWMARRRQEATEALHDMGIAP
jgi:hypothetical protein